MGAEMQKIEALREKILAQLHGQFPGMVAPTLGTVGKPSSSTPAHPAKWYE